MPPVSLVPFTPDEQRIFVLEQIADYAVWLVDQGIVMDQALARAQVEIETELADGMLADDQFWAARDARDGTVGWLWVKHGVDGVPPDAAFLYQILVRPEARRKGHGSAMVDALEHILGAAGWRALHLNVWDTNTVANRLYERAGYAAVEHLPGKRHLSKPLVRADAP